MQLMKFICSFWGFALVCNSAFAGMIDGSYFKSGVWQGDSYYSNDTGEWSHCVVYAQYPNGYDLNFSLTKDYSIGVFLKSRDKPVFKGLGEFEVVTKVDNFDAMFGSVTPIDDDFAGIWYNDLDTAIHQFKKGNTLTVSSKLGIVKFNLVGTFKALTAAYSCASKYQDYKVANFKPEENQDVSSSEWTPSPAETGAMYQLATLLITDFRLNDFKYVPAKDSLIPGAVEFWANDDRLVGIVAVGREKGKDIDLGGIMAKDVANLTSALCDDGDLALVNSTDTISGVVTKSLKGICDSPTEPLTAYLTKQVISDKLIETVVLDYGQTELNGSHSTTPTENLGIIAAKFVKYD
jgi:hypothetical protein